MILSDYWSECGRLLNDPNNNRWSQSVITTRVNRAQTEIQGYTNAVKTSEVLTPVQGQNYLVLNSSTMDIIRATKTQRDGSIIPFLGIVREQLEFRYPDWQQWQAGEPLFWFYDATLQKVFFSPPPDGPNAITNGMTFWESRVPASLVNSTDVPFDANNAMIPYHMAITHWVVSYCWMDNGDPESLGKAKFHRSGSMLAPGEYEKEIGRIMAEFDVEEGAPDSILWQPQGGRAGSVWLPSKSNPLPWP